MVSAEAMNANPIEITRDAVGGALRAGRWAADEALGTLNRVRGRGATAGRPKEFDDITIARKVETVVFRPAGRDKGKIDVNVVEGVVWLRGEARRPADIRAIEADARAVPEVVDVQNLLHVPKTPARRARTQATQGKPRTPKRRVNADKTVAAAGEPLPKDLAAEGQGRPPAPLGAEETEPAPTPTPTPTPAAEPARSEPAPGGFTATNAAGENAGEK
jgi:hypothetical protein